MTQTPKHSPDASRASTTHASKPVSSLFIGLTLNMSWQLAAVLLLGIFGGHELDIHLKSAPLWTVVGLALAMIAMILIVRRTLAQLNGYMKTLDTPEKPSSESLGEDKK